MHYRYYCTHCEGIQYQGSDPLIVNEENLNPVNDWCVRNKGKFAEISFRNSVDVQTVESVVKILNQHDFKFSFDGRYDEDKKFVGIKIDLLDGRSKPRVTEEPNQIGACLDNAR